MKRLVGMICLIVLITACDRGLDREQLKEEVMAVHDAVMPVWGNLKGLQKKVIAKATELEAADSTNAEIVKLRDIALDLEKAYQLMHVWMKDWRTNAAPFEKGGNANDEESQTFFEKEQKRVDEMEKQLMAAYNAAKEALK